MARMIPAALAFLIMLAEMQSAQAQYERSRRAVAADQPTRVLSVWNCFRGAVSGVSGQADRGRVTTRPSTQNRCGNRTQPVVEIFYVPPPGFRGPDDIYIYSAGGQNRVYVNVR